MTTIRAGDVLRALAGRWPVEAAYPGDVNGLVVGDETDEVAGVTVALQLQPAHVDGRDRTLYVSHEPCFAGAPAGHRERARTGTWRDGDRTLAARLQDSGSYLAYAHSPLDAGPDGAGELMARALGLGEIRATTSPYARLVEVTRPMTLEVLCRYLTTVFQLDRVRWHGRPGGRPDGGLRSIGVIPGAGFGMLDLLDSLRRSGAEVVLSGDLSEARLGYLDGLGLAAVDVPARCSERPMLETVRRHLYDTLGVPVDLAAQAPLRIVQDSAGRSSGESGADGGEAVSH